MGSGVQRLALLPHNKKVLGSNLMLSCSISVWTVHLFPVPCLVSLQLVWLLSVVQRHAQ